MANVLNGQVDLYREQSEPWLRDHELVMAQYDLAEECGNVCALGLHIYSQLRESIPHTNRSFDRVIKLHELFTGWYSVTVELCEEANWLVGEGFEVPNLKELAVTLPEATCYLSELQDAVVAIGATRSGTAISVQQFLDEL